MISFSKKYSERSTPKVTPRSSEGIAIEEKLYKQDLEKRMSECISRIKDKKADAEYYEELQNRISNSMKIVYEKRKLSIREHNKLEPNITVADIRKYEEELAREKEEAEITQRIAERVKAIKEKSIKQKNDIENQLKEPENKENQHIKAKNKKIFVNRKEAIRTSNSMKRAYENKRANKKKLPWYATIPVVGAVAIATINASVAIFNRNFGKAKDYSANSTKYTDVEIPATTKENPSKNDKEPETTTASKNIKDEKIIKNVENNNILNKLPEPVIFNVGDKINVPDGLEYAETCIGGGNKNKIGNVSWRPSADYYVEGIAFCYNNEVLGIMKSGEKDARNQLEKYAEQYKIDTKQISTSVLLSLAPGIGDTGWAKLSIEEIEKSKTKVDKDKGHITIAKNNNIDNER